jgi:catechol 2,3-dioxygenase-like lactoylglutathione lyase family enzyme
MQLNHTGIINHSEVSALRFYQDFLGFKKVKESIVPLELSEQLFSVSSEINVIVLEKDGIKLEVFICPDCKQPSPDLRHIGLLVDDLSSVVEKARKANVEVIIGKTHEKTVYFLRDFSGNLIEVKQK